MLAAPWYLHPSQHGEDWARLRDARLAFAVVNVHNGPGSSVEDDYLDALRPGSTTPFAGYIDLDYGRRPFAEVKADASTWAQWYGVVDVFLDQVPEQAERDGWHLGRIDELRALGVGRVIANPGCVPVPELLVAADITCVCETDWATYQLQTWPTWLNDTPAERQWHLVHSVPPWAPLDIALRAAECGAALSWATHGVPPNPWGEGWESR